MKQSNSNKVMGAYCDRLVGKVFKSLIIYEGKDFYTKVKTKSNEVSYQAYVYYLEDLIEEIQGCSELFQDTPEFISILSILTYMKSETKHKKIRKKVFSIISILDKIKEGNDGL